MSIVWDQISPHKCVRPWSLTSRRRVRDQPDTRMRDIWSQTVRMGELCSPSPSRNDFYPEFPLRRDPDRSRFVYKMADFRLALSKAIMTSQ